jgi:hypothetical protein
MVYAALLCCCGAAFAAEVSGPIWIDPPNISTGPWEEGFQLQAQLVEAPVAPGDGESLLPYEPILRLTFRNATDRTLVVWDTSPEVNYDLTIRSAAGGVVKPLSELPGGIARNMRLNIQPGETLVSDYHLIRVYGVLADGEYTIVARRGVISWEGEGRSYLVDSLPLRVAVSGGRMSELPASTIGSDAMGKVPALSESGMLAVRPILERHGFQLVWDGKKRAMTATKGKLVAVVTAEREAMVLAGQETEIGRPAKIINGQLSAPGQAISLITGYGRNQVAQASGAG